jgi:hypothetical protein
MPDLGSLVLRNVKGSPLTFTEGDNNIQYAALQSQSVSYTTHYFQSNSLILSRSNGGGIEIKDLGKFTASYAMNAKTASYALSASNVTNYSLFATYSNYVTNSFTILSESVGRGGFFQFTGSFSVTSSNGSDPQTASFYLPTTFYNDVRFSGSTTNIDGNLQIVASESLDGFLGGIKVFRGEEPGVGTNQQFLALNYAFGNGNIVAFEPSGQDAPTMHFVLSSSTIPATSLLTIRKTTFDTVPYAIFGGTRGYNSNTSTYTSYFSGSAVFLAGATGSLRGTASGNFASASISSNTVTFFNGYNQTAGTLNLANSTNQNLQSVTSVGNSTTSSVNIGASNNSSSLSSVAFGLASIAVGSYSFANGNTVSASGLYSHAEGGSSTAKGNYSHAEGLSTTALGISSHSEGFYTITIGDYSHAEGNSSSAVSPDSHAEGGATKAIGQFSHTEGGFTTTKAEGAHAEGYYTLASGLYSHAEGIYVTASGQYSHAEGWLTTTIGQASHTEGYKTTTKSEYSHTSGYQTIASATAQFVVGHGNIEQTTTYNTVGYRPFIVGAGNISGPRTNLFEVVITKVNGGSQNDGTIVLPQVVNMNYSSSAHAATNGVPVGGVYANGTTLMIRK